MRRAAAIQKYAFGHAAPSGMACGFRPAPTSPSPRRCGIPPTASPLQTGADRAAAFDQPFGVSSLTRSKQTEHVVPPRRARRDVRPSAAAPGSRRAASTYSPATAGSRWNFRRAQSVATADRRVGREPVPLGLAAEVHLDRDVTAAMDVHVPVTVDFKNRQRQVDIDRVMSVRAVVDLVRLRSSASAHSPTKTCRPSGPSRHHLKANQHVPQGVLGGGDRHLGLDPWAWTKCSISWLSIALPQGRHLSPSESLDVRRGKVPKSICLRRQQNILIRC